MPSSVVDVDQDDRPLIEQADFGDDRAAQRHQHRPHVHRPECQPLEHHRHPPGRSQRRENPFQSGACADVNSLRGIHSRAFDAARFTANPPAHSRCGLRAVSPQGLYAREHGRDRGGLGGHQAHALLSFREQGSVAGRRARSAASPGARGLPHVRRQARRKRSRISSTRCFAILRCGPTGRAGRVRASLVS